MTRIGAPPGLALPPLGETAPVREATSVREAAKQFESLLLTEVMKAMRKTVPTTSGGGFSNQLFTSMLDEELSRQSAGGLGLTDILVRQLDAGSRPTTPASIERLLAAPGWVKPLAGQSSGLHRAQQFGAPRPGDRPEVCGDGHCGVDLPRATGAPVVAARAGRVTAVGRNPNTEAGLFVTLRHDGVETRYLHLEEVREDLAPGTRVNAGERIGDVGASGTVATGPHLHFEIRYAGNAGESGWVDPEPWLEKWPEVSPDPQVFPPGADE